MSKRRSFLGASILFLSFAAYFALVRDWETIRSSGTVATVTSQAKENAATLFSPSSSKLSPPVTHSEKANHGDRDGENERKNDNDNDGIDPFEEQPACSRLKQEMWSVSVEELLLRHAIYVNASQGPRYDHACFAMKPRYNCARKSASFYTEDDPPAYNFALALTEAPNNNNSTSSSSYFPDTICDLQKFVRDAGGPAGIGRRMLHNYNHNTANKYGYRILKVPKRFYSHNTIVRRMS